jgi:hypothetical protein
MQFVELLILLDVYPDPQSKYFEKMINIYIYIFYNIQYHYFGTFTNFHEVYLEYSNHNNLTAMSL